ncbi:MAG TPA: hypothetical protein VHE09_15560 [Rhizomicrobium sp.]|jgi:hypothetical protein|nr:hypothetical protein [Rhizomicrobium sp.]
MSRLAQNIRDLSPGAIARGWPTKLIQPHNWVKALLIAFLIFSTAPIAASHAQSHFNTGSQAQVAVSNHSDAQDGSGAGSALFGALEHHACSCPCLEQLPTRSHCIAVIFERSHVDYPAYLDSLGNSFEPDPIRKPPRLAVSA